MTRFMISRRRERGMALVVSILVLFVLTVLGLALMLTTSTEANISTNYRWSEQAFFNADAGLEYGKNVLATYAQRDKHLGNALPAVRTNLTTAPVSSTANRDDQFWMTQNGLVLSVGKVLVDPAVTGGRRLEFDARNPRNGDLRGDLDGDGKKDVQGTVTIWVRRDIVGGKDDPSNLRAILTAEGTAPNYQDPATGRAGAVRRLETTLEIQADGTSGVAGGRYSDPTRNNCPDCGEITAPASRQVR